MDASKSKAQVDTPNPEYNAMVASSELIDALMGGTEAMKQGGTKWLPKEEREEDDTYNVRLQNSILFNRFAATVRDLKSRPFGYPVQLHKAEMLPEQLRGIDKCVDDEGRDLTAFCEHCMEIGIKRGMVHLLVDYPTEMAVTLREERELGLRPMILAIDPKDLFAWQYTKARNGEKTLTQIRIRERVIENDGGFGFVEKDRVRVIYAGDPGLVYNMDDPEISNSGHWELWERVDGASGEKAWEIIEEGPWTIGKISLRTVYFNETGFMACKCPLEPLANLNLAHYQLYSDHRNNLRFAMAKVLFGSGLSVADTKKNIVLGVHHAFLTTSKDADLKVVSDDGNTIEAGEKALRHIEDQMDSVAMGPLMVQPSGNQTATGKAIDEGKGQCKLQAWLHLLEAGMNQSIAFCCEWIGEEKPDEVAVDINDDFELLGRSTEDLAFLDKARERGDIDHETFLDALKIRRVLRENADIKEIMRRCEEETSLGLIGRESEVEEVLAE